MTLRVNESDHATRRFRPPRALHEVRVEIDLQPRQERMLN